MTLFEALSHIQVMEIEFATHCDATYCSALLDFKVDDTPMVVHPEKIDFRRFV